MLLIASGVYGQVDLLLFTLGLPIQLALGGLVALGRRVPATVALLLPILVLAIGFLGGIDGMEAGIAAVREASDPAWIPWFALDDRARGTAPAGLAGILAAGLCLPVAAGAAWRGLRGAPARPAAGAQPAARRRTIWRTMLGWVPPLIAGGSGMIAIVWLLWAAVGAGRWEELAAPMLAIGVFSFGVTLAAVPGRPGHNANALIAVGALLLGGVGASVAILGTSALAISTALGEFADPFGSIGQVTARARDTWRLISPLWPAVAIAVGGALPVVMARRWLTADARDGLDALALFLLLLLVAGTGAWSMARRDAFTRLAGDHARTVLRSAFAYDVPHRAPVPPRVLLADPRVPRWILLRERGGVEVAPFVDALESVGPSIRLKDGLLLPPTLTLEDLYIALSDSGAGEIAVVGCATPSESLQADIRRDALLATGRCGAFPLLMRVTTALPDPRTLIVLRDRNVDDDGEVVAIGDLGDLTGLDVVVRGQADATVADLVALLHAAATARRVFLGFGVDLEGDAIPVGVDPELRIREALDAPPAQPPDAAPEAPPDVGAAPG